MKIVAFLSFIVVLLLHAEENRAFAPHPPAAVLKVKTCPSTKVIVGDRTTSLFYRALDDHDDDKIKSKVQTRTPPGYNMTEAIQNLPKTGINIPLIKALILNQGLILGLASVICLGFLVSNEGFGVLSNLDSILKWTGEGPNVLDLTLTQSRLLLGFAGSLPLLFLSSILESSDSRVFSNINFSTIVMVMTLFGRRTPPPKEYLAPQFRDIEYPTSKTRDVLFQSILLASITGFCEETVFRREIPSVITHLTGSVPLAILGQSLLYGLGHVQPKSPKADNAVLLSFMTLSGLAFAWLYMLAGGDIVPCMIAHAVYDFVNFFKTWVDANAQIEYAESKAKEPLPKNVERAVRAYSAKLDPRLYNSLKRLFYTFDFDKNETLSKSEVRKGISYLSIDGNTLPPQKEVDRLFDHVIETRETNLPKEYANRLTLPDFMKLVSLMKPKTAAPIAG